MENHEWGQVRDDERLLSIGFGFEAPRDGERQGRIVVHGLQVHQDLRIGELALDSTADTLVVVAEPNVELRAARDGRWTLEVKAFDSFRPATGQVASREGVKEIERLMIDTDYHGSPFFTRRIHFSGHSDVWRLTRLKEPLGALLDPEQWEACLSAKSEAFTTPEIGEDTVRIITRAKAKFTTVRNPSGARGDCSGRRNGTSVSIDTVSKNARWSAPRNGILRMTPATRRGAPRPTQREYSGNRADGAWGPPIPSLMTGILSRHQSRSSP